MIRTYLELAVRPGKADELAAFFEREQILEQSVAQAGCRSAELTLSSDGLTALVTATWDDRAAYDQWTSQPSRRDQTDELNTLLRDQIGESTVGRVLDVVLVGAR